MGLVAPIAEIEGKNGEYSSEEVPACPEFADIFPSAVNEYAAAAGWNNNEKKACVINI